MDDIWYKKSLFTLRQGAYLLIGIPPKSESAERMPEEVKAAFDDLNWEVKSGRIAILHREVNGPQQVSRVDLIAAAERLGYRSSPYLFPDQQPTPATTQQLDMTTRERREWAKLVKVLCLVAEVDLEEPYKLAKLLRGLAADLKVQWPEDDKAMAQKLRLAGESE